MRNYLGFLQFLHTLFMQSIHFKIIKCHLYIWEQTVPYLLTSRDNVAMEDLIKYSLSRDNLKM